MTSNSVPGTRLRAVRQAKGLSIEELGRRSHEDPAYISRVERGLQRPSIDFLRAVLPHLGLGDVAEALERVWEFGPVRKARRAVPVEELE